MKNGGQAFPVLDCRRPQDGSLECFDADMSLRDYFAAKAMQGLLSKIDIEKATVLNGKFISIPNLSYKFADEMLKVRED